MSFISSKNSILISRWSALALLLVVAYSASGCALWWDCEQLVSHQPGTKKLSSTQLEDPVIGWEEIITSRATQFDDTVKLFLEHLITETPKSQLHPKIRKDGHLSKLAMARSMKNTIPYEKGVLGNVGTAKYYITTKGRVPNWTRLYWVQVKVLSEKFGCFMVKKVRRGDVMVAQCRDKRRIVMHRSMSDGRNGENWIQFEAKQYDRDGYEILVKRKKIVRVSNYRVL